MLILTACDNRFDGLVYEHFNDQIMTHIYNNESGIAYSVKAMYVVYGPIKIRNESIPAGVAIRVSPTTGYFKYSILELLKTNPDLVNDKALKEAAIQQLMFKKRLPGFYDPTQFSSLGEHGQ